MSKVKYVSDSEVAVTAQDIDDIICTAFEGGITYWCYKAEVVGGKYLGQYASDQISRGGKLKLYVRDYDEQEESTFEFGLDDLLFGIEMYVNKHGKFDIDECDAEVADSIIQYTIFKELVFG